MSLHCNKFLLPACIFFSYMFVSCKKDKDPQSLTTGKYVGDRVGDYSSVRLFTKYGEIKDQTLIDKYKDQYSSYFDPVATGVTDTFTIIDAQQVQYNSINFTVTALDNYYQFRSIDTIYHLAYRIDDVFPDIVKYKPYYTARLAPMRYIIISSLQDYFAAPSGDGLVFPFITVLRFARINDQLGTYYFRHNKINNVFNDQFSLNILNTDTLMVQSYNAYYKKLNP